MKDNVTILVAEDDEGHFSLIRKNIIRAGISNDVLRFANGQEIVDFLFKNGDGPHREQGRAYLLLLDIRMPKFDGLEVLKMIKADHELKRIPVIMLTTTDDPCEIERSHSFGCSVYIVKPVDYDAFIEAIRKIGLFLNVIEVPVLEAS